MVWLERLGVQLESDRAAALAANPFVLHQQRRYGIPPDRLRLPEHFRGPWEQARVCFVGPHVRLLPEEEAPDLSTPLTAYVDHYRTRPERRDPYGHYMAIMAGAPWLATELVRWPAEKEFAMASLKGPQGAALVADSLALTWALLRASPAEVLVLTGNDALSWVMPHLGHRFSKLAGVTAIHGANLGRFPLPGAPGRQITVIASFHWSPEMPLFVRKVRGLAGRPVASAISEAREMIARAIAEALDEG